MDEKRRLKRENPFYFLRAVDTSNRQINGRIVNLNSDGMTLFCEEPITENRLFKFRMALPETIGDRKQMTLIAKSVWCKEDDDPGYYRCGFRFEYLSQKNLETINKLCASAK